MTMNATKYLEDQDIELDALGILYPSFIFICILVALGIPGNILSIIIYGFKLKSATGRYAIISLAVCDVINCVMSIPVELYVMSRYWKFENAELCKMSRFLTYAMNNSSALILLAISMERYRAICTPHKPKIDNSCILRACILLIITGTILALPSLWIYGIQTDYVYKGNILTNDSKFSYRDNYSTIADFPIFPIVLSNITSNSKTETQIETKRCLIDDKYKNTLFAYSHFGFVTIASEIIMLVLVIVYVQIGRKIAALRNFSADEERLRSSAKKKKQATLVLFLITLAFEFTFLPFIIITNIRFFADPAWYNSQSRLGKMAYHLFLRSYYFNNAVNPFIYCVSSSNFRKALFKMFKRIKEGTMTWCKNSNRRQWSGSDVIPNAVYINPNAAYVNPNAASDQNLALDL